MQSEQNFKCDGAIELDLLFDHKKNEPQVSPDYRSMRDMGYRSGLNPQPGAKTNRAYLRAAKPWWPTDSSESHMASHLYSLLNLKQVLSPHNLNASEDYRSVTL